MGFEAEVLGSQLYTVEWELLPDKGWTSSCTCPVEIDCKHAYAAALALFDMQPHSVGSRAADGVVELDVAELQPASRSGKPAAPPEPGMRSSHPSLPAEVAHLVQLLAQRHGRALTKPEISFVRKLEQIWQRHRLHGTIYPAELADVSLAERGAGLYYDFNPAIQGWWETPLSSPLDLWQYLAFFAERANRPLPPLMKPVTDTAPVRARVEALERRRQIEHWDRLFKQPAPQAGGESAPAIAIPEVRLRLASPKLNWEYRLDPTAPWRAAKGGIVRQWFEAIAVHAAGVPPSTLALLQEAQLRRFRNQRQEFGWSGSGREPQTLRLDDASTADFIRWLLENESLRHLFVNEAGETYEQTPVSLVWTARPSPKQPDDVEFSVTLPDGAPLPRDLVRVAGNPPVGFRGRTVHSFPPSLPGTLDASSFQVPREALTSPLAVRHLHRAGVVAHEGLELPEVRVVTLRPCFVCRLADDIGSRTGGSASGLRVEFHARSADQKVVQRWNGQAWTSLPGSGVGALGRDGNTTWDLDRSPAEAAIGLLAPLRVVWAGPNCGWTRAVNRKFPEEFADWAETVRAAGCDLECDPMLAGLTRPAERAHVEMQITAGDEEGGEIDWFDLQLVVHAEDAELTPEEIALLLKARGRFVLLRGKGWRRLELAIDPEQTARLGELGLDPATLEGPPQRQRFHALQLADERIAGLLPEQHAARVRDRVARLQAIPPPPLPATLAAELRPYQREGFHFLGHLSANGLGGVLADDMGLGKTVQALAWLLWLAQERPGLRALVVCPKSVVTNWELETRRFAPALTTATLSGRTAALPAASLIVINYAQLRLAVDQLQAVVWDAVILDEGQNIKNPQSQTAQAARGLRAPHRLVLTGTPIENRVLDLWSLFAFAMPGLLGGQTAFKRAFNDKTDPLARARLARRVRHFMLRRTKRQVAADLPPRIEEDLVVELEPGQRKLYDAELKRARQMLLGLETARQFDAQRFNILQSLLRLRQICCDPRLLGAGGDDDSAKVAALFDQLEPIIAEGHKVLVFSQFVSMLEILQRELAARDIAFLTITGQTENRQELVDRFQTAPGISVFLLSLKAAGSGLNLTAASYVVLFDPWWNPAVEAQAIDRTHRIGQTNQVIAYRLIAKDTVEEKIRRLKQEKAALARAVVQEESLATVMNLDDLRYVLA